MFTVGLSDFNSFLVINGLKFDTGKVLPLQNFSSLSFHVKRTTFKIKMKVKRCDAYCFAFIHFQGKQTYPKYKLQGGNVTSSSSSDK